MAHERQAIRNAIVAQLIAGDTSAEARVFKSRMTPLRQSQLPAIGVYIDGEEVDDATAYSAPRELKRTLTIAIEAWVNADERLAEKIDDTFDAIALQIETAMDADDSLTGTCDTSFLSSTEFGIQTATDRPMGCVHLEYTITYHTDLRTALRDGAFDNFNAAGVDYASAPAQAPADRATDLINGIHK